MKKYEKPNMSFNNIRLNQSVADTCWGLSGTEFDGKPGSAGYCGPFYYNVEGEGYLEFSLRGTDGCGAPDAFDIVYYENQDAQGDEAKGLALESVLETALTTKGGNNGQPYKGLTTNFPTEVNPTWS